MNFSADLPAMQTWAAGLMVSRPADVVIGDDYLRRWWVIPRNPFINLYLHQILASDDDRALHDHPWASTSFIIAGGYLEHTPDGVFQRSEGDVTSRAADAMHRLEVIPGVQAVSLFATGPKVRDWGFDCAHGWVHWCDFTDETGLRNGAGCGEVDLPAPVSKRGLIRGGR